MKRYFMEEHHTSANFHEMVALALDDLTGQKLLWLGICLKRMCKRHRKVLEMKERPMMSRIYPSMSVAELKSWSTQTMRLLILFCAISEDAHDNTHRRDSKNHWNITNWRFYERVMHMMSIQLFTGGIPVKKRIKSAANVTLHSLAQAIWGYIWKHMIEKRLNKCNQCDYASSRADCLRTHKKTTTAEKLNKWCIRCHFLSSCNRCEQTFENT